MDKLFSIRDCGRLIGVAPHRIAYEHTQDRLPEPHFRVVGKRIYTWEDCRRVAEHFGVEIADREEVRCGE